MALRVISDEEDSKFRNKRVLVRVDFNVNIENGIVGEDYRIRMTIPTLEYLTKRHAKVLLCSHLGRPGGPKPQLSLAPVANRLSEIFAGSKVRFVEDCVGDEVEKAASSFCREMSYYWRIFGSIRKKRPMIPFSPSRLPH